MAVANAFSEVVKKIVKDLSKGSKSADCKTCMNALKATSELGDHLVAYYNFLTILMLICTILCLVESIFACVSCCFWKKRVTIITTTAAPGVVAAPIVAQPVAVV